MEAEHLFPSTSGADKGKLTKKRSGTEHRSQKEKKGKKRAHRDRSPSVETRRIYKKSSDSEESSDEESCTFVKSTPQTPPPTAKNSKKKSVKETALHLFGQTSDDEASTSAPRKENLISSITQRVANGSTRQIYNDKKGSHYIELKIYNCGEIENVPPMNRWRQAVIAIKNKTDVDTEAWKFLTNFIAATRVEFKNVPASFVGSYPI